MPKSSPMLVLSCGAETIWEPVSLAACPSLTLVLIWKASGWNQGWGEKGLTACLTAVTFFTRLNNVPPKVSSCLPGACKCDLVTDVIKLRWGHIGLGCSKSNVTGVFIRREAWETCTWRTAYGDKSLRLELCVYKPRNAKDCQPHWKLREVRNRFSPRAFRESMAVLTPWLWTSVFQNYKGIHSCCFESPNLW